METCRILVGQVEDNLGGQIEAVRRQNFKRIRAVLENGSPADENWALPILRGPLAPTPYTLDSLLANCLSLDFGVKFFACWAILEFPEAVGIPGIPGIFIPFAIFRIFRVYEIF